MRDGVLDVALVTEGACEVEVALCTIWIQLDGQSVRMNGMVVLAVQMVCVAKVIEGWVVQRVESDCLQVVLNCLGVIATVAIRIT